MISVKRFTDDLLQQKETLESWKKVTYDVRSCESYRKVEFLEQGIKVIESI